MLTWTCERRKDNERYCYNYPSWILLRKSQMCMRSACQSEKIKNVEITLNTPNAYETIEKKIAKEFKDRLSIGAGTVKTFDSAALLLVRPCPAYGGRA